MPEHDRDLLTEVAEAAGKIAMRYFRQDPKVMVKADESPVTEADLAVNAMLETELRAARPGHGWLSEESPDDPARLGAERVLIVDPIDGTRAFIAGRSAWGVALAIAEAGRVVASAFHMPAQGKTYAAAEGAGAMLNGARLAVSSRTALEGAEVLTNKAALKPENWRAAPPKVGQHFRPSLAYRLCLVAEGRFDAALTFRDAWEWDIAAGDLICREAGAKVTTKAGETPLYNAPGALQPGLLAAPPALHRAIRSEVVF